MTMRTTLNRLRRDWLRRWIWQPVFGEEQGGRLLPHTRISSASVIEHEDKLVLGDNVFIGAFNFIEASGGITIEEGVQITSHCAIVTHSSHRSQRLLGPAYVTWPVPAGGERPGWIAGPDPHRRLQLRRPAQPDRGQHAHRPRHARVRRQLRARHVPRLRDPRRPARARGGRQPARRRARAGALSRAAGAVRRVGRGAASPSTSKGRGERCARPLRVVLFGDGESPHLLKWARALAPRVELYVASSRGLAPALAALVAPERTLLLGHATKFAGGNARC